MKKWLNYFKKIVKMSDDDEESTSGSQSTLFGSVKSSKSSASFFGSCKSTGLYKEYLLILYLFYLFSNEIFSRHDRKFSYSLFDK